jgi:ADP-ribose pyrophosphatase
MMTTNPSDPSGVQLKSKIPAFEGYLRIDRYRITHQLYDGGWSKCLEREVMSRSAVAGILLFDSTRQEVVLVEQFRIGAWAMDWPDPWLLECVAGVVEPGEKPADVAIRESWEEAGCNVTRLELITRYLTSPGSSTEQVDLFCGQIDATGIGGHYGLESECEDIRASVWPLHDALALLDGQRICNSLTLISLQWLSLHHRNLTIQWSSATEDSP